MTRTTREILFKLLFHWLVYSILPLFQHEKRAPVRLVKKAAIKNPLVPNQATIQI